MRHFFEALFVSLFAFTGLLAVPAYAGCDVNSFAPEQHVYYGDAATILAKLDQKEVTLADRRFYVALVEGKDAADLTVFEAVNGDQVNVWHWHGSSISDLKDRIDRAILLNRGVFCVGEQVKHLLMSDKIVGPQLNAEPFPVASPATINAALRHVLKDNKQEYIRVTLYLLC